MLDVQRHRQQRVPEHVVDGRETSQMSEIESDVLAVYDKARAFHREKGWVCFENEAMGIYFIKDPDGYWLEILPPR